MLAILWHWFDFPNGGVLQNIVASLIGVGFGYTLALWHMRCLHCWRLARVPVKGTVHHVCRRHALEHGHTH